MLEHDEELESGWKLVKGMVGDTKVEFTIDILGTTADVCITLHDCQQPVYVKDLSKEENNVRTVSI